MHGWRRWLFRDNRLRTLWRVLLFVAAFVAILQLELLIFPVSAALPLADDRISAGLVVQSVLALLAALLAGWAMLRWVDEHPLSDLGFSLHRGVPRELAVGLLIGAGAVAAVVFLLAILDAYQYRTEPGSLVGWLTVSGVSLAAFAMPAAAEEAVFRGYLFRTLVEGGGALVAIFVTGVLFTVAHGSNPNVGPVGLLNIFLASVLLAVAVLRTGSLWFASSLHLGWNWVMAAPLDLPVSGLGGYDVPLYELAGSGPAWLTGGPFGPEGGLAGTLAVCLALGVTWRITRPGMPLGGSPVRRYGHG